jgi:hypothetical protein
MHYPDSMNNKESPVVAYVSYANVGEYSCVSKEYSEAQVHEDLCASIRMTTADNKACKQVMQQNYHQYVFACFSYVAHAHFHIIGTHVHI